jgi:hypothetical protein
MLHGGKGFRQLAMAVALCAGGAMAGCGGPEVKEKQSMTFSLGAAAQAALAQRSNALSAGSPLANVAAVVVSIEDSAGAVVKADLRLAMYAFSGSYVSDSVQLDVGAYHLTKFLVVDAANTTLFAAPNAADANVDPKLVAQVKNPLPIAFTVAHGLTHSQPVEVLPVDWHPPQDFGYVAFSVAVKIFAKTSRQIFYGAVWYGIPSIDQLQSYTEIVRKANGQILTSKWFYVGSNGYDGRGQDGLWLTDDDVPAGTWWERSDLYGSSQGGPGPDGIWLTGDDTVSSWQKYDPSAVNGIGYEPLFNDPGPDGVWFTDDDVMYGYYKCYWDAATGAQTMRVIYTGPGPDGQWYTDDDQIGQDSKGAYVRWTSAPGNNIWDSWSREVTYSGPGADGIWFTADDTVYTCKTHVFGDGTQHWTEERGYTPGYDNTCFTYDDQLTGYTVQQNTY